MNIEVGQRWRDRDKRMGERTRVVVEVDPTHVILAHPTMETVRTRVRRDILVKRWQLVSPSPPPAACWWDAPTSCPLHGGSVFLCPDAPPRA